MLLYWSVMILFAGGYFIPAASANEITIIGNEKPLINQVQQDITCIYSGQDVVAIQWIIVIGPFESVHIQNDSGIGVLTMSIFPTLELTGSQFKCRVIDSQQHRYERTITITVKEVEHSLNITASHSNPVFTGSTLTLTCVAVSNRDANLYWVDSNGDEISSGNGIDVSTPQTSELTTIITLTFISIRTTQAGNYSCKCELDNPVSDAITTYLVYVQQLEPSLNITASHGNPVLAGTELTLTCVGVSDRAADLYWVNSNGYEISSGNGIEISVPQAKQGTTYSIIILTFVSLKTSRAGIYRCKYDIDDPITTSHHVDVQIPEPRVSIFRDPEYPVQLFTSHSLVLTCVIELIPEVDSYVAIHSQWRGHSSLTDNERRVIVSDLEGDQLIYRTSINFNTLKSSDSGYYVCSASVNPLALPQSGSLIGSPVSEEEINISIVLKVTIDVAYNPPSDFTLPSPPYYRPATSINLTCLAHGTTGTVNYEWYSTCTDCFVSSSTSRVISDAILQSNDAGVHTCTAVDSSGNTGNKSTEMNLIGAGLYVQYSQYLDHSAVVNNSLIVQKSGTCRYCKVDVYCHSDSTSEDVGYYVLPNGREEYRTTTYYYSIGRVGYAGVRIRSYSSHTPTIWGVFTCVIPDSEGNTIEISIGIYSSLPRAPSVYSSNYTVWSTNNSLLGTVECLTQYSPPTYVTWLRDGVAIEVDGEGYEMIQSVIERRSYSRYNNTLLIRNAADLAGNHTYNCTITNTAGNTTQAVNTTLESQPIVDIDASAIEAVYLEPFTLTCRATLNPKVVPQLIRYLVLEWVSADGQDIGQEDGVTVEEQLFFSEANTRSLVFDKLNITHGGDYKCEAVLILPENAGSFNTTVQYHINVLNWTIIQLKFGPVVHCSKWYEDKRIAEHLERDIKQTLVGLINEKCNCSFQTAQIYDGEFSCRTLHNGHVIYRARIEGTSDTLSIPEILAVIQEWMECDGTFLNTYHARTRLELDPHCPVEVGTFSHPEPHSAHDDTVYKEKVEL